MSCGADGPQSRLRKRRLSESVTGTPSAGQLAIADCATLLYSSEDPAHAIENLVDERNGPGGTYWASDRFDVSEHLVVEFDAPQSISRLIYEAEETVLARTQEVRIEVSDDSGKTWQQLRVQDYVFSPRGATFQHEEMDLQVPAASHLRLTIVPNKSGSGKATLTSLRLFD